MAFPSSTKQRRGAPLPSGSEESSGSRIAQRYRIGLSPFPPQPFRLVKAKDLWRLEYVSLLFLPDCLKEDYPIPLAKLQAQATRNQQLEHPLLLNSLAWDEQDGHFFLAQEWPEGESLALAFQDRRMRQKVFSLRVAIGVGWLLCRALEYLHEFGFHGFLNPQDIYLEPWPEGPIPFYPKIALTGIRETLRPSPLAFEGLDEEAVSYAAPEFLGPGSISETADLYGAGAILYTMLTLRPPQGPFLRPSHLHPGSLRELDQGLLLALEDNPDQRFDSAREMEMWLRGLDGLDDTWEELKKAETTLLEAEAPRDRGIEAAATDEKTVVSVATPRTYRRPPRKTGKTTVLSVFPPRLTGGLWLVLLVLLNLGLLFLTLRIMPSLGKGELSSLEEFYKWDRFFIDSSPGTLPKLQG